MNNINEVLPVNYFDNLPDNIKILMISLACKIDSKLNILNVMNKIKNSNNPNFMQVYHLTHIIKLKTIKKVNVIINKKNGLMTIAARSVENIHETINEMIDICKDTEFTIDGLYDFKIINFNFSIESHVIFFDLNKIYKQLKTKNYDCKYAPTVHAGIYIVHNNKITGTRILTNIFKSGNVLTTGAKRREDIIEIYNFTKLNCFYDFDFNLNLISQISTNDVNHVNNVNNVNNVNDVNDVNNVNNVNDTQDYDLININMEIEI
ncbi:MAG: hypothetical protein Terrestrivirus5_120 [Terrestrivirus sp.]|uniref:Uncharacterized protein n=1 Tax=Terrestrivirus sp. TaxID=2487775 RepID=A0A3G4ZN63_9VIRU|nr:MAG: hypothetical protein Terrestrivirus5_120 [Terrestrivirus sp.]